MKKNLLIILTILVLTMVNDFVYATEAPSHDVVVSYVRKLSNPASEVLRLAYVDVSTQKVKIVDLFTVLNPVPSQIITSSSMSTEYVSSAAEPNIHLITGLYSYSGQPPKIRYDLIPNNKLDQLITEVIPFQLTGQDTINNLTLKLIGDASGKVLPYVVLVTQNFLSGPVSIHLAIRQNNQWIVKIIEASSRKIQNSTLDFYVKGVTAHPSGALEMTFTEDTATPLFGTLKYVVFDLNKPQWPLAWESNFGAPFSASSYFLTFIGSTASYFTQIMPNLNRGTLQKVFSNGAWGPPVPVANNPTAVSSSLKDVLNQNTFSALVAEDYVTANSVSPDIIMELYLGNNLIQRAKLLTPVLTPFQSLLSTDIKLPSVVKKVNGILYPFDYTIALLQAERFAQRSGSLEVTLGVYPIVNMAHSGSHITIESFRTLTMEGIHSVNIEYLKNLQN